MTGVRIAHGEGFLYHISPMLCSVFDERKSSQAVADDRRLIQMKQKAQAGLRHERMSRRQRKMEMRNTIICLAETRRGQEFLHQKVRELYK